MRNRYTGEFELSRSQMDTVVDKYRIHFSLEKEPIILHNNRIRPGFCHLDVAMSPMGEEVFYGTFGASAKKSSRRPSLSEVYLFMQGDCTKENNELARGLLLDACTSCEELGQECELGLLYDYEYLWIDNGARDDWDSLGYKGIFIKPEFSEKVWRNNTIKFFRVIPAYAEELQWVEANASSETPYHSLIKTLLEAIPERRCVNVKYPVVSFEKL